MEIEEVKKGNYYTFESFNCVIICKVKNFYTADVNIGTTNLELSYLIEIHNNDVTKFEYLENFHFSEDEIWELKEANEKEVKILNNVKNEFTKIKNLDIINM